MCEPVPCPSFEEVRLEVDPVTLESPGWFTEAVERFYRPLPREGEEW